MDGQEYLNQISAKARPQKSENGISRFLKSKVFLFSMIGIGVLVVLVVLMSFLGKGKGNTKNDCLRLITHLGSTAEVIEEYQSKVKSSSLRSSSASLYSVIANTNMEVTNYVIEKYNMKLPKDINKAILEQAESDKEALANELFEAKINGVLDRIYASKMAFEISTIMTEENSLLNETKDDILKEALNKSRDSLKNLYDRFDNFSETSQ